MSWTAVVRKPFEQELHDMYDAPAKERIANFMEAKCGVKVETNPDQYGIDLLVSKDGNYVGGIEVEVRQWSPTCPFATIHVPERKEKFFGKNTLYFALTKDMRSAYWIEGEKVKEYPIREVSNYKVASGEKFYDVPTSAFTYTSLEVTSDT